MKFNAVLLHLNIINVLIMYKKKSGPTYIYMRSTKISIYKKVKDLWHTSPNSSTDVVDYRNVNYLVVTTVSRSVFDGFQDHVIPQANPIVSQIRSMTNKTGVGIACM